MVKKQSKNEGFTLIELILATSLLMIVLFSGYYAYSLYSQKWQKRVDVYWRGTNQSIGVDTVNKLISSTILYSVKSEKGQFQLFFSGDAQRMQFVTSSPIYLDGDAIVELSIRQNSLSKEVVYKEKSLADFVLIDTKQFNATENNFWDVEATLIDGFEDISFAYFGWQSFEQALNDMNLEEDILRSIEKPEWYTMHKMESVRIVPEIIQVNFQTAQKVETIKISLPTNSIYFLLSNIRKGEE
ncbi:type II secretion system protein J [Colwelliaceae bacterium 6471]